MPSFQREKGASEIRQWRLSFSALLMIPLITLVLIQNKNVEDPTKL